MSTRIADAVTNTEDSNDDRRSAARVPFSTMRVSFAHDTPGANRAAEFEPATAENLSQTGISFFASQWPEVDRLLVRFGDSDDANLVRVKIVSCHRDELGDNQCRFEVRCEFVEWLSA